jgi:biopolymer transport protein ExbD
MRAPSNLARGRVGFNMTPMIDVVFLLIIFFLVSSNLAQQEVQLDVDLPEATSGNRPEESDLRRIVVNVLAEGNVQVGTESVKPDRLADLIRYEARRAEGQLEVRIRCNRNVPYRAVEPILLAAARAGVWNVTFAVVAGPSGQ